MAATREETGRRDGQSRATAALAVGVATMAVVLATWWATRLGDNLLATVVAVATTVVATAAVALVVGHWCRSSLAAATLGTLAFGVVVVTLSWTGLLLEAKVARSEAGWQGTAESILRDRAERGARPDALGLATGCVFGPLIDAEFRELEAFGRVDEICVTNQASFRSVSFSQMNPTGWTGLRYEPERSAPNVSSTCVRHLDGPWWQTASAQPNCPPGFEFIPGG